MICSYFTGTGEKIYLEGCERINIKLICSEKKKSNHVCSARDEDYKNH
jgi:hypothetical protein